MKAHLCIAGLAIIISLLVYQQSNGVLFYCVFSLCFMEILNTVVENLVDLLVKKEYHNS